MVSRIPLRLRFKAPEEIRFSSDDVPWIKGLQNLVYYKLLVTFDGAYLQIPSVFGKVTKLGIFVPSGLDGEMCCFRYFMAEQNAFCDPIEFLSRLKTFVLGLIPPVSSIDVDNSFTGLPRLHEL
jgi:hypothetical protein